MVYTIEPKVDDNILQEVWNREVENHAKVKCIKSSDIFPYPYVCFNYALNIIDIYSVEEGMEELEYNYKRITIEEAKKGDIVTYHADFVCRGKKQIDEYSINHFAIISKTDGTIKGTIIKSKWGRDGVFRGALDEIPDCYGEIVAIWRKK